MVNVLSMEKKVSVVSALAEGAGVRSTERMTGVNRNTIMRLLITIGKGCERIMDQKMRRLSCGIIEVDELWGFIFKKRMHRQPSDDPTWGDVWTFFGIDPDSKLIPCYRVGDRSESDAEHFMMDLASRMSGRIQLSSDSFFAYEEAVYVGFGDGVDYAQVIKEFGYPERSLPQRRYSPPGIVKVDHYPIIGSPKESKISTSHVERANLTVRMHVRRLTRLTNAFSKKLENFKAAMALFFVYYNFSMIHRMIDMTPAMKAEVAKSIWTIEEIIEKAE